MKAIRFHEYGGPEVLRLEDAPVPEPGPGQLRVAVRACGVNPIDSKIRSGSRSGGVPLAAPMTTGHDGAGVVTALGSGVEGVDVGAEVFGYGIGLAAEEALLIGWALKPNALTWEQAASLGIPGETAGRALSRVELEGGDTIVIDNAAGGVGGIFVQLARSRGLQVIGTCSTRNADYVRSLGAIPVEYGPGLPARVASLGLGKVRAAFDLAGKGSVLELIEITGDAAQVVSIVDFTVGRYGAKASPSTDERHPEALAELAALAAAGRLHIEIAQVCPLAQAAEAQRRSQEGHVRGKLILVP